MVSHQASPLQQLHQGQGDDVHGQGVHREVGLHAVLVHPPLVHHAARVVHQHVKPLVLRRETQGPGSHLAGLGEVDDVEVDLLWGEERVRVGRRE